MKECNINTNAGSEGIAAKTKNSYKKAKTAEPLTLEQTIEFLRTNQHDPYYPLEVSMNDPVTGDGNPIMPEGIMIESATKGSEPRLAKDDKHRSMWWSREHQTITTFTESFRGNALDALETGCWERILADEYKEIFQGNFRERDGRVIIEKCADGNVGLVVPREYAPQV